MQRFILPFPRLKEPYAWLSGLLLLSCILLLPFWVLGGDVFIRVFDHLDYYPNLLQVVREGKAFSFDPTLRLDAPMHGEIPRAIFSSPFHISWWFWKFLPPFAAWLCHLAFIQCLSYSGMYLLLRRCVLREERQWPAAMGISLVFGLLPAFPLAEGYLAVVPFFILGMQELSQTHPPKWAYALCLLMPLAGNFFLTGIFLCAAAFIGVLWLGMRDRKFLLRLCIASLLWLTGSLLAECNMIFWMFSGDAFISHRERWPGQALDLVTTLQEMLTGFRYGHFHSLGGQEYLIFPLAIIAVFAARKGELSKPWRASIGLLLLCAFLYGLFQWEGMAFIGKALPLFRAFNFYRVGFLIPVFVYLILGYSLAWLYKQQNRYLSVFAAALILFQLQHVFRHDFALKKNYYAMAGKSIPPHAWAPEYTWRQVMAEDLYAQVSKSIPQDASQYRVASLGLLPAAALYAGFRTVDGYFTFFPADYRKRLNRIMQAETDKAKANPYWSEAADGPSGNYCYLLSAWLQLHHGNRLYAHSWDCNEYLVPYVEGDSIPQPDWDYAELKQLGCDYLFSALPIRTGAQSVLQFQKAFRSEETPFRIFLYELN